MNTKDRIMVQSSPLFYLKTLWQLHIRKRPVVLSHGINSSCNLRCSFCDYWMEERDEMSTEEIFDLLREARSFGILFYNAWTTEPLLREDLPEILEYAHQLGMITSLITNGKLLEERIDDLEHLDYLSVSVDGIRTHKQIRGLDFAAILPGIVKARDKFHKKILINCVISNKNLTDIEDLVKLVQDLNLKISFEPVHEFKSIDKKTWEEFGIDNRQEYEKIVDRLIEMKKEGYPIINSITYLSMVKNLDLNYRCHASDIILNVTSDGEVEHCRVRKKSIGNIREGITNIWDRSDNTRKHLTSSCEGCLFFGYVENSLLYEFRPEVIKNYEWM
ncbi:radical SAM protein [Methanosalsum zhilinae]|nr:radical SAM protein [Methanosalsum zhilinae]